MFQLFDYAPYSIKNTLRAVSRPEKNNVIYPDFARHRRALPASPTKTVSEPIPLRRMTG